MRKASKVSRKPSTSMPAKHHRQNLLLSTALIASGMLAWQGSAVADQLVDSNVVGPVNLTGSEALEVTESGSITTSSAVGSAYGVEFNDGHTITNSGAIGANSTAAIAGGAVGLSGGSYNEIENAGTIDARTSGESAPAVGIFVGDENTITNSGAVSALTEGSTTPSAGIFANDENTISNSGTVSASSEGANSIAAGIRANDENTISNSGQIEVETKAIGSFAIGIDAGDDNTIDNANIISATALAPESTAIGIDAFDHNDDITNSGTIEAKSTFIAYGIRADDDNTISNAGTIYSYASDFFGLAAGVSVYSNNTISNSGTIEAVAADSDSRAYGIDAYDTNQIENSGSIKVSASGDYYSYADGVNVGDGNTITNSGDIEVTVSGIDYLIADGIDAENDNSITNSGTIEISITGNDYLSANGIEVDDNSTIDNSGDITITMIGSDDLVAEGIEADNDTAIENSGNITVSATGNNYLYVEGIEADYGNTISNSGTIAVSVSGQFGYATGIDAFVDNAIHNSGTITVSATGQYTYAAGIFANEDNVITNSGKILASADNPLNAYAILLNGDGNTINLEAPSFLAGQIDLRSGSANAVNITTGPSHSVLWTFEGVMDGGAPTVDGPVPGFWNAADQQFATIDPTLFAAADDWLADMSGMIFNGLRHRAHLAPSTDERGIDLWMTGLGSTADYDGDDASTMDREMAQYGFMGGIDFDIASDFEMGLLVGYAQGQIEIGSFWVDCYNHSYDSESGGFFAGIHGGTDLGRVRVEAALLAGMLDHDYSRFINDNLQTGGIDYATASYQSWWLSPEISLSMDFQMADDLVITPTLRGRYAAQWIDGFTETGSADANATVASHMAGVAEVSAEVAATRTLDFGTVTGRAGVLGRFGQGDESVDVTLVGQTQGVSMANDDFVAGFAGLDVAVNLSDRASVTFSGQAMVGDTVTRYQGAASIGIKF